MGIIDVQGTVTRHCHICVETSPFFTSGMAQIKGTGRKKRKTTQEHVSICSLLKGPGNSHPIFHGKCVRNVLCLIPLGFSFGNTYHFLETDNIRVDLSQDFGNPLGPPEAIKTHTLVDVVRHHP